MSLRTLTILAALLVAGLGFGIGRSGVRDGKDGRDRLVPEGGAKRSGAVLSALSDGLSFPAGGSVFEMSMAIGELVKEKGAGCYGDLWEAVQRLPVGQREPMELLLVEWWGKADPASALDAMGQNYHYKNQIYRHWAGIDAEAAWERAQDMRYGAVRRGFEEEVVIGLARSDRDAAIALAQREKVNFESDFYVDWVAEVGAEQAAAQMIEKTSAGFFSSGDFYGLAEYLNAGEGEWMLFKQVADASGDWRNQTLENLLEGVATNHGEEVFTRALADPEWLAGAIELEDVFDEWASHDRQTSIEWFRGLAQDSPLRVEMAWEAIYHRFYQNAEEAAELLNLRPDKERARSAYEIAAYDLYDTEDASMAERLAWVELWRSELGPEDFERSVTKHVEDLDRGAIDSVEAVGLAVAAAEAYGKRDELLEHAAYVRPEVATPWLLESMAVDERAPFLVVGFENLLEDFPEEGLELIQTLTEPSDIAALRRGIDDASIPTSVENAALAILEDLGR